MKKLIVVTLAILFASSAFADGAGEYNLVKKADGSVEWPFAL